VELYKYKYELRSNSRDVYDGKQKLLKFLMIFYFTH